jgi:hypothetical protein
MIAPLAAALLAATTALGTPAVADQPAPRAKICQDRLVGWIKAAGFKGVHVRVAWSVAMRESNGQPGESTLPDLGLYQLNAPTWQGTKYWPADVYDPIQNAKAVKRMVKDKGWQPWGLRVSGGRVSYDFASYGMWSSWQHANWIVEPFERYWAQFPRKCR